MLGNKRHKKWWKPTNGNEKASIKPWSLEKF
jgi:hypothetical protein